jgi:hypothetical protein
MQTNTISLGSDGTSAGSLTSGADRFIQQLPAESGVGIGVNTFYQHHGTVDEEYLDLQRRGRDYTILNIRAPEDAPYSAEEATLALSRKKPGDATFMDLYNIGYESNQFGIRIQKRGPNGYYRPFVFDFYDGKNPKVETFRVRPTAEFQFSHGVIYPTRVVKENTAIEPKDVKLIVQSAKPVTLTLPSALGRLGQEFHVIQATHHPVTLATVGEEAINNEKQWTMQQTYSSLRVLSDGANWVAT